MDVTYGSRNKAEKPNRVFSWWRGHCIGLLGSSFVVVDQKSIEDSWILECSMANLMRDECDE